MFPNKKIRIRDVTQTYIREHDVQRDIYLKHVDQFNIPQDSYLELLKPLYGLIQSGGFMDPQIQRIHQKEIRPTNKRGILNSAF